MLRDGFRVVGGTLSHSFDGVVDGSGTGACNNHTDSGDVAFFKHWHTDGLEQLLDVVEGRTLIMPGHMQAMFVVGRCCVVLLNSYCVSGSSAWQRRLLNSSMACGRMRNLVVQWQ